MEFSSKPTKKPTDLGELLEIMMKKKSLGFIKVKLGGVTIYTRGLSFAEKYFIFSIHPNHSVQSLLSE